MSYKFNPFTGTLDWTDGATPISDVERIVISKTAGQTISALKVLRASGPTGVLVSDPTGGMDDARSIAVALTSGTTGSTIQAVAFGRLEDSTFNFAVNEPLFLGVGGTITNVALSTGTHVPLGFGLGAGAIFVTIDRPIILN